MKRSNTHHPPHKTIPFHDRALGDEGAIMLQERILQYLAPRDRPAELYYHFRPYFAATRWGFILRQLRALEDAGRIWETRGNGGRVAWELVK